MNERISVTYKGLEIYYVDYKDQWQVKDGDSDVGNSKISFKDAREVADRHLKSANGFKKFEAFHNDYDGGFKRVTVTSVTDDDCCWIVNDKGRRQKSNKRLVYKVNEANEAIVEAIKANMELSMKFSNERQTLLSKLQPID